MSANPSSSGTLRWVGVLLLVVGVALLVVGIVYFAVPAAHLPSLLGRLPHATGHRRIRAITGVAAGVVLGAAGAVVLARACARR